MGRNLDPAGALPEEDASGCISLSETNANFARAALATFIFSCLALWSLFFWYAYLSQNGAPQITNIMLRTFGFMGIAFLPILPFLFGNLLYPPSLIINDDGIAARKWGRTRRLPWSDIQAINLREARVDRCGNTKTKTTIQSGIARISFMPLFGVAPAALADYINRRRNKASPGLDIIIGNTGQPRNLQGLTALAGLAVVAVLVVFITFLKQHAIR